MGALKLTYYGSQRALAKKSLFLVKGLEKNAPREKKRLNAYRYGFNGMEKDNEVKGQGNSYDYKNRIQDPRLGRFLSVDPLTRDFPFYTPYQFAGNKPIWAIDLDGLEELIVTEFFVEGETEPYKTQITIVRDYSVGGATNEHQIVHRQKVTADLSGKTFKVKYVGTDKDGLKPAEQAELNKGLVDQDGKSQGINTTTLFDGKGEAFFEVPNGFDKDGKVKTIKQKTLEITGSGAAPEKDLEVPGLNSVNNLPANPEDRKTSGGVPVKQAANGVFGASGDNARLKQAGGAQGGKVERTEKTESGQTIIREAND